MIKKLKNLVACVLAMLMSLFIVGCNDDDQLPTVEKVTTISTIVGRTAGYACELSKTKHEVKESISVVLNVVSNVVPEVGKSFTETWTPIIDTELNKLVEAKKLDESGVAIAKIALKAATEGIDYLFNVKLPKARDVKELVSAATTGFIGGYRSVVTAALAAGRAIPEIDEDALKYIKAKISAK